MVRIFFGFAFLFFSFNSFANTVICNSCSTSEGFKRVALQKDSYTGDQTTYVVNQLSGTVYKYTRTPKGLKEFPVEQPVVNFVRFVQQSKDSQVVLDGRGDFPANGYEMVEYPQMRSTVGAYIKQGGWGLAQDYVNFLSAVGSIGGFNSGAMTITIRIIMSDGSTSLFVYNNVTQTWEAVKGQTRDSNNNIVPETAQDVSGGPGSSVRYEFPATPGGTENLVNFIQRLEMLGVPITGSVGGAGSRITVFVCTGGVCVKQYVQ